MIHMMFAILTLHFNPYTLVTKLLEFLRDSIVDVK